MLTLAQILLWTLVAIPFLILVAILAAATYGAYSLRRSIQLASSTPCHKCGTPLGKPAVLAAQEALAKQMAELRKKHPNVMFRTVAEWEIRCSQCGTISYFYPETNTMEVESRFAKATTQQASL